MFNLIRIIYSIIIVHKHKGVHAEIIDKVLESNETYWLKDSEICSWVNYLKFTGKCKNWSRAEMFREIKYHNVLYKYGLFRSHTKYADFEETQTFKTYLRRFICNILW